MIPGSRHRSCRECQQELSRRTAEEPAPLRWSSWWARRNASSRLLVHFPNLHIYSPSRSCKVAPELRTRHQMVSVRELRAASGELDRNGCRNTLLGLTRCATRTALRVPDLMAVIGERRTTGPHDRVRRCCAWRTPPRLNGFSYDGRHWEKMCSAAPCENVRVKGICGYT